MLSKLSWKLVLVAVLAIGTAGCSVGDLIGAQATPTLTRTPRPTFTPLVQATNTFVPLPTTAPTLPPAPTTAPTKAAVKTATRTPTRKPPTPKPATAAPPTSVLPTFTPQPVVSQMEFRAFVPKPCEHSGGVYIKGTVYLDKNDPNNRYVGAIVALGSPDGSTIWADPIKTDGMGEYTFTLSTPGAPPNKGSFGIWLVTPALVRKSDVGGPIVINGLGPDSPGACWAGFVDFVKN